jgi:UDP-N-acetylglucosamine acyltransferase
MERRGLSHESIRAVHESYKILYRQNLSLDEAMGKMLELFGEIEEVRKIVDFMQVSKNGILRPRSDRGEE